MTISDSTSKSLTSKSLCLAIAISTLLPLQPAQAGRDWVNAIVGGIGKVRQVSGALNSLHNSGGGGGSSAPSVPAPEPQTNVTGTVVPPPVQPTPPPPAPVQPTPSTPTVPGGYDTAHQYNQYHGGASGSYNRRAYSGRAQEQDRQAGNFHQLLNPGVQVVNRGQTHITKVVRVPVVRNLPTPPAPPTPPHDDPIAVQPPKKDAPPAPPTMKTFPTKWVDEEMQNVLTMMR